MRLLSKIGGWITPKMFGWGFDLLFQSFSTVAESLISTYGLVIKKTSTGAYETGGSVSQGAGTTVDVQPFTAIVKDATDSKVRRLKETAVKNVDFSALGDATYKVLLQYGTTFYEKGTILVTNGDDDVVGTGTEFTKNIDTNLQLVIDSSVSGNNGKYPVDSVQDDTHLRLRSLFGGTTEGSLKFAVGGYFPDAAYVPGTDALHRIYEQDSYSFVVTTGAVGAGQLWLADVIKAGAVLTITDRRDNNIFQLFDANDKRASFILWLLANGSGSPSNDASAKLIDGIADVSDFYSEIFSLLIQKADGSAKSVGISGGLTVGKNSAPSRASLLGAIYHWRTATAGDYVCNETSDYLICVTSTAVQRTITLPLANERRGRIIIVKDESGGAATNNITVNTQLAQTIDGQATKIINANFGVFIFFSNGSNWFTLNTSPVLSIISQEDLPTPQTYSELFDDFPTTTGEDGEVGSLGWGIVGSAGVSLSAGEAGRIGILTIQSPSSPGAAAVKLVLYLSGNQGGLQCVMSMRNSTNSPNANHKIRIGFVDIVSPGEPSNGVYFRANGMGNWECVTRAGGTETVSVTGIAQSNTNFKQFKIVVNGLGTEVKFYIDKVLVATHVANIPTGFDLSAVFISEPTDATARGIQVDYFFLRLSGLNR